MKWFLFFILWLRGVSADALDEFISLRTFRSLADHAPPLPQDFSAEKVKAGDILYVRDSHAGFFQKTHPQIQVPYILITHGNPCSFPGPFEAYLEDPQLVIWFAQNLPKEHSAKIEPLPLGIPPQIKKAEILQRERGKVREKTILLYVNFSVSTRPEERGPLWESFSQKTFCTVKKRVAFEEYVQDLASAHFVLCPRGVALDSFRTWEALYMGAIPIVKNSSLDPVFEELPVLIVHDWEEISESFLLKKLHEMRSKKYRLEKLSPQYWMDRISHFRYLE